MYTTGKSGIRAWAVRFFLILILSIVSVSAVSGSDMTPLAKVQAASSQKIYFKDGSGKYLEKIGKKYYLRNKKGKKLTGIQYLKIATTGNISSGHYWFNSTGMLVQKRAVKKFEKITVKGVTFD